MEDGEIKALLQVWSTVLASLSYSYWVVSKIPSGTSRLLSLLPIFFLFSILPLFLSSVLLTGITAFFITWLATFKLLLYAFNLGPLSEASSFPIFILTAAFPIKIKPRIKYPSKKIHPIQKPRKQFLGFWSKFLFFSILVSVCDRYRDDLPSKILLFSYCWLLYFFIDIALGVCNKLTMPILGVELEPPSDEPYLSTSLQDFWGRRWNLMVTDTLRHTVYLPLRSLLGDSQRVRIFAVLATFIVSGLVHELIFFYMARVRPTWEVTWFFVLHGVCVGLEMGGKKALGSRWTPHWALSGPLTIGLLMITGFWLFFPQLVRNRVDFRAIEECKAVVMYVKGAFLN